MGGFLIRVGPTTTRYGGMVVGTVVSCLGYSSSVGMVNGDYGSEIGQKDSI